MKELQFMRVLSKIVYYLIFSIISITVYAQQYIDNQYLFSNYNTRNGLINNVIYSITQDSQGFIWFGSDMGLTRFDGKFFFHKAIPEIFNTPTSIHNVITNDEGYIICTSFIHGVFEQSDNGSFKRYFIEPEILNRNIIYSIKQYSEGKLLLATQRSLLKADDENLTELYDYGLDRSVFVTIDIDHNNTIWFGGINGIGKMEQDGEELKPFFLPELKDHYIVKIMFDNQGVLHAGTANGYYRIEFEEPFNPVSGYKIYKPFDEMNALYINNLYIDRDQNLWITTSSNGAYMTKGDSITLHLNMDNGLLSPSVLCMMQDHEGNYWFGTNSGLSMVEDFDSYMLSKDGKLFQAYYDIIPDSYGRIWIPDQNIFHVYVDNKLVRLEIKNTPLEKNGIDNIFIDEDLNMWIYNDAELFRLRLYEELPDLKNIEKIADLSTYSPAYFNFTTKDDNGLWLCTNSKILQYHHDRLLEVRFNHPDSSNIKPVRVEQDRFGYYWISDYINGLYRASLVENSKDMLVFDNIKNYKSFLIDSTYSPTWVNDMRIDHEGNLWEVSTYSGVYKHTIDSSGVVSSMLYSTKNGLSSNVVVRLSFGEDGRAWFYTQNGTNILTKEANGAEHFTYINNKNGIEGQPINSVEQKGKVFMLTDDGFFITQNNVVGRNQRPIPRVIITNLLVNGIDNTLQINKKKTFVLNNTQNNLAFDFSSIAFKRYNDSRYQYMLEGISTDWSDLSERSFVEYSALSPGKYKFKVRAVTYDGIMGDETSFSFKISPAFYQSFLFYLIILVIILLLFYSFYKYRINQIIKIENMRSRIASDLHDDIGSTLSSIFLMSEMTSSNDKRARLAEVLHKISENSRNILNSMDDIIWSVNPQEDSLASLMVRLREYAMTPCEARKISLYMNVGDSVSSLILEMDERRNIYLITKEAINNAIKHSGCTKLEVTFSVINKQLEVVINDNGEGFDMQLPSSRNGLVNMNRRAQQINCEMITRSEKGRGTTIRLKTKNHMFI